MEEGQSKNKRKGTEPKSKSFATKNAKSKSKGKKKKSNNLDSMIQDEDFDLMEEDNSVDTVTDHNHRPLWVSPDGHIFLETFSRVYKPAYDFLVAIAEPECRSSLIHEYQLTPYSLYAAVSVGLSTNDIITVLNRLSKTKIPKSIEDFIKLCTINYGKVKLVLQRNRYFIESRARELLEQLLKDDIISKSRILDSKDVVIEEETGLILSRAPMNIQIAKNSSNSRKIDPLLRRDDLAIPDDEFGDDSDIEDELQGNENDQKLLSFEIDPQQVEQVKKQCIDMELPMLEEYDFRNDTSNPNMKIDLKITTQLRAYQEKSLSKMFGNGRARSGIIVLPCGAGKTLVGVTAACTIKKSTLVLCTSSVSVEQWRQQFRLWSTIEENAIARFTSNQKEQLGNVSGVTVTTYTMVAFGGKRSKESLKIMEEIQKREWGLVILDEVHVVPANIFRKVLTVTKAHCKLGLTATLVREDEKISDLNFLIGPKLYEANWMDLQKAGHIATVQCVEVWCEMSPEFYSEYLTSDSLNRKMLLYIMNPVKFRNCQFLIRFHEQRGDKIIVFSDNIFALQHYANKLNKPFIYGPTSSNERMRILQQFQRSSAVRTIFISKVGDTSIDLPEANVIIQISSHFGSRRQEAQRLGFYFSFCVDFSGRILRPKAAARGEFNAFFYSLVSKDTQEMFYSSKRQQFLIDQGYAFKVVSELPTQGENLHYETKEERLEILRAVLTADESAGKSEELEEDFDDLALQKAAPAERRVSSGRSLAGGETMVYSELRNVSPRPESRLQRMLSQQ